MITVGGPRNSIDRVPWYSMCGLAKIASALSHTSIGFMLLLEHHNRPHLSSSVQRLNLELEWLLGSGTMSYIGVVLVDSLFRWEYTRHGLTSKGKGNWLG